MAKGNLLLGTAANSVGDVVMYRREGAQVSRVRVRKVKNPKTNAQSTQRAFFAPVAKFYSPLAIVLERSFEGLSKAKSYAKFLKTNVDLARANDWLLPKGTGFFPLPYKLSQGSLPSLNYILDRDEQKLVVDDIALQETDTTIAQLSTAFVSAGFHAGDIVTFICLQADQIPNIQNCIPYVAQFEIDTTSTALIADALKGITLQGGGDIMKVKCASGITCAAAIVVARYQNNVWRRNSQSLSVDSTLMTAIGNASYKADAIASYGATNTGDNPLVYLDGEELNG